MARFGLVDHIGYNLYQLYHIYNRVFMLSEHRHVVFYARAVVEQVAQSDFGLIAGGVSSFSLGSSFQGRDTGISSSRPEAPEVMGRVCFAAARFAARRYISNRPAAKTTFRTIPTTPTSGP